MNRIEQQKLANKIEFPPDRYQRELMIVNVFKMQNEGLTLHYSILDCISKIKEPRSIDEWGLIGIILWKANFSISPTWKEDLISLKPEQVWIEWDEMCNQTHKKILSIPFELLSRMIGILSYHSSSDLYIKQIKTLFENIDLEHFENILCLLPLHKDKLGAVDYRFENQCYKSSFRFNEK